jgi:hypothetical protein
MYLATLAGGKVIGPTSLGRGQRAPERGYLRARGEVQAAQYPNRSGAEPGSSARRVLVRLEHRAGDPATIGNLVTVLASPFPDRRRPRAIAHS